MSTVAVVVPWRPGCPHREAAWSWVRSRYESEHPGWPVIEGTPPAGPWVKALAVEDALARTDADLLVIADADVWVDGLAEAVDLLAEHPTVVPHKMVMRLDQPSTESLIAGRPFQPSYDQRPYIGRAGGGVFAIRREVWDRVPMDPRFAGWGGEDDSWVIAIRQLVAIPHRLTADLTHLWHPPQERLTRSVGSEASALLNRRYLKARHDRAAMQTIVDEARALLEVSRCS